MYVTGIGAQVPSVVSACSLKSCQGWERTCHLMGVECQQLLILSRWDAAVQAGNPTWESSMINEGCPHQQYRLGRRGSRGSFPKYDTRISTKEANIIHQQRKGIRGHLHQKSQRTLPQPRRDHRLEFEVHLSLKLSAEYLLGDLTI